jgi:hypothetical protein
MRVIEILGCKSSTGFYYVGSEHSPEIVSVRA